jgi:hypothetical protein
MPLFCLVYVFHSAEVKPSDPDELEVFAIIQASAVFYEIRKGLGKPGNPSNTNDILPMEKVCFIL